MRRRTFLTTAAFSALTACTTGRGALGSLAPDQTIAVAPTPDVIFNMPTASERAAELQADHQQKLAWATSQQIAG